MLSTRMPQASEPIEHKTSNLLTTEENQAIVRLLGPRCQALATCVIQLYQTQPPHHAQWIKKDTGVLCLVKDNFRKNYFFRLYCFRRSCMVYEQELYNNMDYVVSCPFLHTFEGDDCMIGFNYANEDEGRDMKITVEQKLHAKRKREERRIRINNENQPSSIVPTNNSFQFNNNNNITMNKPFTKKDKQKRNLTKADIGKPLEFRHIAHVGWDPDKGFAVESLDDNLKHFFQKAGVSESHLKDKDTREFIYDFIELNGGRERLEQESWTTGGGGGVGSGGSSTPAGKPLPPVPPPPPQMGCVQGVALSATGPPVPPRGAPKPPNRMAPKPPSQSPPTRAPAQTPASRTSSSASSSSSVAATVSTSAAPPPPPLPVAPLFNSECSFVESSISTSHHNQQHTQVHSASGNSSGSLDVRSALMQSIRSGAQLKSIDVEEKRHHVEVDARDDLLCEIRKGIQLKPANEREVKPISPPAETVGSDLAAALNRALRERNRVIHSEDDSNSDDTDDDDDEWEA